MAGDHLFNLKLIGKVILFILFMTGCSSNQPNQNFDQSIPYSQLSTQDNSTLQSIDNPPSQQLTEDPDSQQLPSNQGTQQQTVPDGFIKDDRVQKQGEENTVVQNSTSPSLLPFHDFKERWNAVSEEQMSNLYIKNIEESSNTNETIYHTRLSNHLELRIFVHENYVHQLELTSDEKTTEVIYQMLAGWNQVINMLHPTVEMYDVDALFRKIGVGPNADLSNLKATSFDYFHLHYEVLPTDNGYTFRASYRKS
jgi:PBP1b-binding outer membrane lipoprotein LpoB